MHIERATGGMPCFCHHNILPVVLCHRTGPRALSAQASEYYLKIMSPSKPVKKRQLICKVFDNLWLITIRCIGVLASRRSGPHSRTSFAVAHCSESTLNNQFAVIVSRWKSRLHVEVQRIEDCGESYVTSFRCVARSALEVLKLWLDVDNAQRRIHQQHIHQQLRHHVLHQPATNVKSSWHRGTTVTGSKHGSSEALRSGLLRYTPSIVADSIEQLQQQDVTTATTGAEQRVFF